MSAVADAGRARARPSFRELFTPRLATVLKEGCGLKDLKADVVSGARGARS
jgi:SulP family sulfate permease